MANKTSTFVKKPVETQAILLNSLEDMQEALRWIRDGKGTASLTPRDPASGALKDCLVISTSEGDIKAYIGDYIVQGVRGEFYPIKAEVFQETYEPVDLNTYGIRVMFTDGNTELFGPYDRLSDAERMLQSRMVDQDKAPGPQIEPIVKAEVVILTEDINCDFRAVSLLGRRFLEVNEAVT